MTEKKRLWRKELKMARQTTCNQSCKRASFWSANPARALHLWSPI